MPVRPVAARARRTALIVASVPEVTNRTCSTAGMARAIRSANSTSPSVGAPNDEPASRAFRTASTTLGWAWPRMSGPQLMT